MASPLLINESPLQVLPTLALRIGLNESIILQQVHYWLNPKFNKNQFEGRHWVYNTYDQWQQQFPFWGEKTIRRVIASLEEKGVLISFITRDFKKIKYYTIDYDRLNEISNLIVKTAENMMIIPSGQNDQIELPKRADRRGQNDQIDQVKLTRSYIDTEITQEITLHPSDFPKRADEEEDEVDGNIFQEMLQIWNEAVQDKLNGRKIAHLPPKRKEDLSYIYKIIFGNKITFWKAYCQQIAACRFLMGENQSGFKVTLDWALNCDNACKVIEGGFYDKLAKNALPSIEKSSDVFLEDLKTNTSEQPHQDLWIAISQQLLSKIGQSLYQSWFATAEITDISKDSLTLQISSAFFKDYIRTHFHHHLMQAVQSVYPAISNIQYHIAKKGESTC